MLILHPFAPIVQASELHFFVNSRRFDFVARFSTVKLRLHSYALPKLVAKVSRAQSSETQNLQGVIAGDEDNYNDEYEGEDEDGFSTRSGFRGREEERDYDRDPEFAEILGSCLDDPEKAQSKVS